jgi:hypothetical protein
MQALKKNSILISLILVIFSLVGCEQKNIDSSTIHSTVERLEESLSKAGDALNQAITSTKEKVQELLQKTKFQESINSNSIKNNPSLPNNSAPLNGVFHPVEPHDSIAYISTMLAKNC